MNISSVLTRAVFHRSLAGVLVLVAVTASPALAATLTRSQAVAALLAPGSGVSLDLTDSAVWSPYVDFGFGPGFEGLLPVDSRVNPHELGLQPFPGPGMTVSNAAYFFWVDDLPPALFQHPARFVLVNANVVAPTVGNGGIRVSTQGWWPQVILPGGPAQEFFATSDARRSPNPPSPINPEGLIAGTGYDPFSPPAGVAPAEKVLSPAKAQAPSRACGLLVRGDPDTMFGFDMELYERDLRERYGVEPGRIIKANGGNAASKADLAQAITDLCALQPPCDKIFIRMTSHGNLRSYCLAGGAITNTELCTQFKRLAAKGVPICLLINGCVTGSLLDAHNWDFPAGSVIITTAGGLTNNSAWGHSIKFTNSVGECVTNTLFPHAFSKCLNDPTAMPRRNDEQAFRWVLEQMPCYTWTGNGKMYYPAGSTNAGAVNPDPQIRTVGRDPNYLNLNVRNGTGAARTGFHMLFQGDVRGGVPRAWRSNPNDQVGSRWAENGTTVTYDPTTGQTMVCWNDPSSPVAAGDFIHFGYCRPAGGLRSAKQYWTQVSPPPPPGPADKAPTKQTSFRWTPGSPTGIIRIVPRSAANGGEDLAVQGAVVVRISPTPIPLDNLNLGDPMVTGLPAQTLGTFVLQQDQPREFTFNVPPQSAGSTATLIVQSQEAWPLNGNQVVELAQIPLVVTTSVPPFLVYERPSPNQLLLRWDDPTARLQTAPQVIGPWSDLSPTSPFGTSITPEIPGQMFRLFIPPGF